MLRAVCCGVVVATVLATAAAGQLVQQSAKLTGAGEVGQGRFGVSVALSADGNTALVGGNTDNNTFTFGVGAAWVFTRTGSSWAPQGPKLTASDGVNLPAFGFDVALSADGNTALIGGPGDHGNIGAVWTFTRSGGVWTQQKPKLTAAGEVGAGRFGETVALSADGTTAVVGAPHEGDGTLRVYTRSGGAWVQQGPALVGSGGLGFVFLGENLALSADGSTILASGENENTAAGAAWVFARSGGTWSQQGPKLTVATSGSSPRFAAGLALSADGNLALIGASREAGVGGFWQFARSGSTWTQVGTKVTATHATAGAGFGGEIALSADGSTALVGGSGDSSQRGAAWLFKRAGSTYEQHGPKRFPPDVAGSSPVFGARVALSATGATALVSAPNDSTARGAAWTYVDPDATDLPGAPPDVSSVAGDGQATVSFTPSAGATSYTVTGSPGGATATGTSSPIVVPGLSNGTSYTFTVTASNAAGVSSASAPSNAVTPFGLPAAPTAVSATAGDGYAQVQFTPPASDGGAAILYYTVTASPGGQSTSGTAAPITVYGLGNDVSYTFSVTATNAAGPGPASTPSGAVTPAGPERPHPDPPAASPRADIPAFTPPSSPRVPPPHR